MSNRINLTKARINLCRSNYECFVRTFWDCVPNAEKLQWNWHMSVLCQELQEQAERVFAGVPRDHDTIINIAPGSGKTFLCTILYTCWIWTRMPKARILLSSYGDDLVSYNGGKIREVLKSDQYQKYFPEIGKGAQDSNHRFFNSLGGECHVATVLGIDPLGRHYHFQICDDLLSPKRAASEAERSDARSFVVETLPGRRVRPVCILILVMQRVDMLDPTAVLLEIAKQEHATPIRHFCFPAELPKAGKNYISTNVSPPELAKYYVDGLFDTKRYPRSVLQQEKARMTLHGYESQFLQNPVPRGGTLFKEIWLENKIIEASPYESSRCRAWDIAASLTGDYTAGVLLAKDKEGCFYIEDVQREQFEPDQRDRMILRVAEADRRRYGKHAPTIVLERQPGAAGIGLHAHLTKMLAGFSVRPYLPSRQTGDKEMRAEPLSTQMAIGNVKVVKGHWNDAFTRELFMFPRGVTDDQVDAASMSLFFLTASRPAGTIRILHFQRQPEKLRIVVCSREQYESMSLDENHILIYLDNPEPFSKPLELPPSPQRLRMVSIQIADIDPRDEKWQLDWDKPLIEYGKKENGDRIYPEHLMAVPDHGKKVWRCILQKSGNSPPTSLVICDNSSGSNDRRAISAACALADVFHIPREQITKMENAVMDVSKPGTAPNVAVYDAVKNSRMMVVD